MARQAGKQNCGRVVLVSFLALLAAGLVGDFLWASSHPFSSVGMSLPSSVTTVIGQLPPNTNVTGMVTDGRYIYIVTGQYGPQCRGPTAKTFVLDTDTNSWSDFVPLPVPRYAPATQLWRGRLHVMGGSKENMHTAGLEHWSIAVKDGKALEKEWRSEIPIPRGGPHRACVVVDDRLFVIGGKEGDFMAKPGSPIFKCSRRME
ncbi:kelch repeat-containing protein At3g27220-like, partial [Capsella rubella]|uniref:kelch repeat-containing protein At3g27220-like n=1 Tax=Capsella rubella TaxID=81985 RepID=UPI000CD4F882